LNLPDALSHATAASDVIRLALMKLTALLAMIGLASCGGRLDEASDVDGGAEGDPGLSSCETVTPTACSVTCSASDPCEALICPNSVTPQCPSWVPHPQINSYAGGPQPPNHDGAVFCCPLGTK
jgi:hypothetical protein